MKKKLLRVNTHKIWKRAKNKQKRRDQNWKKTKMQIQLFHLNEKFHHLYFFIVCHERLLKIPLIVFERLFPSA